jgi:hypothetical protein
MTSKWFCKVENDVIIKDNLTAKAARKGHANFPPESSATDDDYRNVGCWPKVDEPPGFNELFQIRSAGVCRVHPRTKTVFVDYVITDKTAEQIGVYVKKLVVAIYETLFYTDVDYDFPTETATIQFRDEKDRKNLSDVALWANGKVAAGEPDQLTKFRTKNNNNQSMRASQMVNAATAVFDLKMVLINKLWVHKDNIQFLVDANDRDGLIVYDVNAGW